jgi:hypothetical protein
MEAAVNETVGGIQDKSDMLLIRWDPLTDIYTLNSRQNYNKDREKTL